MTNDDMKFSIVNENGEKTECDVLFTFDSEETGKSYIVYTDNSHDANGNVQVFASIYNPKQKDQKLLPIKSEKEWKVIEIILEELQQGIQSQLNGKIKPSNYFQKEEDESNTDSDDREHRVYEKIVKMKKGDKEEKSLAFDLAGVLGNESLSIDISDRLIIVEKKIDMFYQLRKYNEIKAGIESCACLTHSLLKDSVAWLSCALDAINDYDNEEYYHITSDKWESLLEKTLIKLANSSISVDEIESDLDTYSTALTTRIILSNFSRYLLSIDNVDSFKKYESLFSKIDYKVTTTSAFSMEEEVEKSFTSIAAEHHSNSILFYLIDHDYR